jgi:TnpA family transposase
MTNLKRLYLLSQAEIDELYARPIFNQEERGLYFDLNKAELDALEQLTTTKTRLYFILQLGYFKAKHQFFTFNLDEVNDDVTFLLHHFFHEPHLEMVGCIARNSISLQKQMILKLFDYKEWSSQQALITEIHVCELLRFYPKGHDTLRQLLSSFDSQHIILPTYRTLQDLFTRSFATEDKRLDDLMQLIPDELQKKLIALVSKGDGLAELNIIRADQKNFQYASVKAEVDKALDIAELYQFAKKFIPVLKISKNAVRYYADLADNYAPSRVRQLHQSKQWLQIICFIHHRYQQMMDNLITSFIYHTRSIIADGKEYADNAAMEYGAKMVVEMPKLAQFLMWYPHRDKTLTQEEQDKQAYNILPVAQFPVLAQFLGGKSFDKKTALWEFYAKSSRTFALYLRPIMLAVPLIFYKEEHKIVRLMELIKNHYGRGKAPAAFKLPDDIKATIPEKMLTYLKRNPDDESVDPHLFEFYVYRKMYQHLDKGRLCCNDSISYCDIDHDLIEDHLVDDIEKIATKFGYPLMALFCDEHLDESLDSLDKAWDTTTERIKLGQNTGFKTKETQTGEQDWSLRYDSKEELDDAFFNNVPKVDLIDILMFIGDHADMWSAFTHMKHRYNKKKKPEPLPINACLMANAFGISMQKMLDMSDLSYSLLRSTQEDFIRVGTLCAANDIASNLIHALLIFKLWNLINNETLADADGQKLPTSESTIQSRYSRKFLGKAPGLSIYTLVANNVAVNAKNIGPNEYEGHALYDILSGNKTDIDITMVTGDNHSLNQLNFVFLDSINVGYVPSIKNIREAANNLYSVKPVDTYTGILRPKGVINSNRIKSHKRGILRVLLSLLLQENTQTTIVRKLNSYARYEGLRKALFEYNKILKSRHVLNLIDDMSLRQAIRTARNRTEAYHQLQGLIRKVYHGVFKGKTITDNRISAHAVRLIANCIIAYNSIILNAVYENMLKAGVSEEIIAEFARISPIAWVHIAFTGKYNFKKSTGVIDIAALAHEIEKHIKQHFWKDD